MSVQLTEQEKAEGWREFNGGECPVNKNDKVQVRLRCSEISCDFARAYTWHYSITPDLQIIAYRLIEQENSKNNGGDTQSAFNNQVGGDHYKRLAIQPAEYCFKNNIGHLAGDAIAYITRYQFKNGVEDLRKAQHSLDLLIELENGKSQ